MTTEAEPHIRRAVFDVDKALKMSTLIDISAAIHNGRRSDRHHRLHHPAERSWRHVPPHRSCQ